MSYIRMGYPLVYVEGNSKDYIYLAGGKDGECIEDYGSISDKGFLELLSEYWDTKDTAFKNHLLKRLADRLGVKLRKKPLTDKKYLKLEEKNMEEFEKKFPDLSLKKVKMSELNGLNENTAVDLEKLKPVNVEWECCECHEIIKGEPRSRDFKDKKHEGIKLYCKKCFKKKFHPL